MALCASCGNDIFGGKVCYSCGTRVAGVVGNAPPKIAISQPAQQQMSQQTPKVSPSNLPLSTGVKKSNSNKIVIGIVGAVILVGVLVGTLSGRNSSEPYVAPTNQDSGSVTVPESNSDSQDYPSYDNYPYEFRSAYMDSCQNGSNYEYCLCVLENMENLYSIDEATYLFNSGDDSFYFEAVSKCI